jgi:uncharacterized protein YuzE
MKMSYFEDTDTLYIEFKSAEVAVTQDLDQDTILDLDDDGQMVAITIEHASQRADISNISLTGLAA